MSTFAYKALDPTGSTVQGEIEAEDKVAVASQLRSRGLIVVDIDEQSGSGDIFERFKKVKADELTVMTRQFSTMVSSGMSMLRALYVLEDQQENPKLKDAISQVRKDVEAGLALSDALARHPDIFNELYVAMVAAGETGGILEETLKRVADQLEKDASLRRQIKSAMVYPIVIISFAGLVVIALVAFLVPVFEGVFKDFGGKLPAITQVTVTASHLLTRQPYIPIAIVVGVVWGFRRWKHSKRGKEQWDRIKLRFPFKIGDVVQKVALARFARTYSALIAAGVPMLEAIEITGRTSGNVVVENAMHAVHESVRNGGTIAAPMRTEPDAFPGMVVQMVAVGEETGALDSMLSKIADFYEDEVEAAVKALTSILEPIMIIIVGGIVGFVVVAMYLPLFKVYDQIK
ncbi:MAG TPA: type II secretion system F family protein [Thermoleophilaceae bacterium]|jgi:type IV pilus assembly protein PilC|nr:type II secretion system F family protein [Thermoleophilaceae bacterium]